MPSQSEGRSQNPPTELHCPGIRKIADILEEKGYTPELRRGSLTAEESTTVPHIEITAPATDRETLEDYILNLESVPTHHLIGPNDTTALPDRSDNDPRNTTFYILPGARTWSPTEIAEKRASFI